MDRTVFKIRLSELKEKLRDNNIETAIITDEDNVYKSRDLQPLVMYSLPGDAGAKIDWQQSTDALFSAIDRTKDDKLIRWLRQ